jgi:hypothetical protein
LLLFDLLHPILFDLPHYILFGCIFGSIARQRLPIDQVTAAEQRAGLPDTVPSFGFNLKKQ